MRWLIDRKMRILLGVAILTALVIFGVTVNNGLRRSVQQSWSPVQDNRLLDHDETHFSAPTGCLASVNTKDTFLSSTRDIPNHQADPSTIKVQECFTYLQWLFKETSNTFPNLCQEDVGVYETISVDSLLNDFKTKLKDIQSAGLWKSNPSLKSCSETTGSSPCNDTKCGQRPYQGYQERLQSVIHTTESVNITQRGYIMEMMKVKPSGKRVLIVTGSSSDHFLESQGLIQSLHQNVFQELDNYTFVYYDLGLDTQQREQLRKHCRCEVRRYPVEKMPHMHQKLRCYTWKPFIIEANIRSADILIWADASVRFPESSIGPLLKEVNAKGAIMEVGTPPYAVSDHVQKITFDYFGEQTCHFAQVGEMQATFLVFKNERFIREAILKPWIACALDSRCMCPSDPEKLIVCYTYVRKYNKCHRFDQAALNLILAKLFWGNEQTFTPSRKYIDIKKEDKVHYFDQLGK